MRQHAPAYTPEAASASSTGERLSLPALQSKMKRDPEGYETELRQLHRHLESSVFLFRQQAALSSASSSSSSSSSAKELGDLALFLAHVAPLYPDDAADLPDLIGGLLDTNARALPSGLRVHLVRALILLVNRKIVDLEGTMELFMELQVIGDRAVQKLAFSHIVHSIRRMNQKHKDQARNRKLQNILFKLLQGEEESRAKRAFTILCDLHRRRVWVMTAAISSLLGYENVDQEDDSDGSSTEEEASQNRNIVLSKEVVYKANHKGTIASKKKKKAKLQRVARASQYEKGFAKKLFSRLQECNERFEVRMAMLKVISRTIGLHHLVLLNFYPYLQTYVQPHQPDVTTILAAAVQACHEMVPPDAVEPMFKQIVDKFVHEGSKAIDVGLNVVREICMRIPLLMNEDLLQDLVLYKKSHEIAVSIAARSLITLFREICPSLLAKKDRGRPIDPTARPKAFGEASIPSDVPGAELLDEDVSHDGEGSEGDSDAFDPDDELVFPSTNDTQQSLKVDADEDDGGEEEVDEDDNMDDIEDDSDNRSNGSSSKGQKRKLRDYYIRQLDATDASLGALKRLAGAKQAEASTDRIFSDEDFKRIRELKAKKEARLALVQHGLSKGDTRPVTFKLPSSDELSMKRVDTSQLESLIKRKMSKEERLELVKAGREDRGKYQARAVIKKKKAGGSNNKQKQHQKRMPLAANRAKAARSRQEKKTKAKRSRKQFSGRKACK